MSEPFELSGHKYSIAKMDARKQFHVARKLAGVLIPLLKSFMTKREELTAKLKAEPDNKEQVAASIFGEDYLIHLIPAVCEAVSAMSDVDADFIMDECLVCVQRQDNNRWSSIRAPGPSGMMMYQDIELPDQLKLVGRVVADNLGNFIAAL